MTKKYTSRDVARFFAVAVALANSPEGLSELFVSRVCGFSRMTAWRVLGELFDAGLIDRRVFAPGKGTQDAKPRSVYFVAPRGKEPFDDYEE